MQSWSNTCEQRTPSTKPQRRDRKQHNSWHWRRFGTCSLVSAGHIFQSQRRCLAHCIIQHLWHNPIFTLYHLHPVSRISLSPRQTHIQYPRSLRDISADRRILHTLYPCDYARPLGLEYIRCDLGPCHLWYHLQSTIYTPLPFARNPILCPYGLANHCGYYSTDQNISHFCTRLACNRRSLLYSWLDLLQLGKIAIQPQHLASVCTGR